MASVTMAVSFIPNTTMKLPSSAGRRSLIVAKATAENTSSASVSASGESGTARRDLVFAGVAAAACSLAKVAMAVEEPKRGTLEAKKKYASVCVTNPTARICRY